MNEHQPRAAAPGDDRWLNEWECTPRDGPAVLAVDTATLDTHGTLKGRWLTLDQPPAAIRTDLAEALGYATVDRGAWVIVDQIGLGNEMLPEQLTIAALHRTVHDRSGGGR